MDCFLWCSFKVYEIINCFFINKKEMLLSISFWFYLTMNMYVIVPF